MRTMISLLCLCFVMAEGAVLAGQLEDLGVPMRKGGFRNACVGPDASGRSELMYFNFSQAAGKAIFMLAAGPDHCIYGSGAMPMDIFKYDPKSGQARLEGTINGGEVYSMFAFDPVKREKLYEVTPLPGESGIKVLAAGEGKVFGVGSRSNKTFVFDPQTRMVTKTFGNPFGSQVWGSYRVGKDGLIWGLTTSVLFTLDPKTCEYRVVTHSPKPVTAGLALTEEAVYFASGAHLWRYRL